MMNDPVDTKRDLITVDCALEPLSIRLSGNKPSIWNWDGNTAYRNTFNLMPHVQEWCLENLRPGWSLSWQTVRREFRDVEMTDLNGRYEAPCVTFINENDLMLFRLAFSESVHS